MRFRKLNGLGNDFVVVTDLDARMGARGTIDRALVAAVCDRHTGVGADGLIRILADGETAAAGAAVTMDYYNADGSTAEMCGNGVRCVAFLAQTDGLMARGSHGVLTGAGVVTVTTDGTDRITVDMGEPTVPPRPATVDVDGATLRGTVVGVGTPHFVMTPDVVDDDLVATLGPRLETHPAFPAGTNVEFAQPAGRANVRLRVWERGVGETQACGSGACATAVALAAADVCDRSVAVELPGGTLDIDWRRDNRIHMTGPAEQTFEGEIDAAWLSARGVTAPSVPIAS